VPQGGHSVMVTRPGELAAMINNVVGQTT
jgi:hypothetical protein